MMFKQIVRAIATRSGIHASFLPKPLPDQAGSGLHINLSLYMDGRNLFEGDIAPDSIAGSFMAGVLAHSRELTVFTNPLPNSYQRFGCDEAPRYVSWSRQNRSQLVRIPMVKGDNCRMLLGGIAPKVNKLEQAKKMLRELAETSTSVQSSEIFDMAEDLNISKRTLENAKKELEIKARRIGNSWYWDLDKVKPE